MIIAVVVGIREWALAIRDPPLRIALQPCPCLGPGRRRNARTELISGDVDDLHTRDGRKSLGTRLCSVISSLKNALRLSASRVLLFIGLPSSQLYKNLSCESAVDL